MFAQSGVPKTVQGKAQRRRQYLMYGEALQRSHGRFLGAPYFYT